MAATDEDLQTLGKPPTGSVKGGRMELRDEKLCVSVVHERSSAAGK